MSYIKETIARLGDLKDGEMKEINVRDTNILLAYVDGKYYATQAHCSHYGASLAKGSLCGTRVICPWHHACFDVTTGRHLEAPGLDSLPTYEVSIEGDEVVVSIPENAPTTVYPPMVDHITSDQHAIIIGGGAAGVQAAQALREADYQGAITIITSESAGPYDRTALSKKFLQDGASDDDLPLRPTSFYQEYNIQLLSGRKVIRLDADNKTVRLDNDQVVEYDKAIVCTGSQPKQLPVPGADFPNVYPLRSLQDGKQLKKAAQQAEKVVIIGASFIGMECAASLQKLGCSVTVISPDQYPFASKWGERIGKMIKALHESEGVTFYGKSRVERIEGDSQARTVVLDTGETLSADLILVGIGVQPITDFIDGLNVAEDGGISVDSYLHAGKDVYAAGDIARFEYQGQPVRIEHWRLASQQGKAAGLAVAGKAQAFDKVPFFWTAQQGKNIRYVGFVKEYDDILYQGEVESQDFIALYAKDGKIRAALGMNRDKDIAAIEHLMQLNKMPAPSVVQDNAFDWQGALTSE